MRVGFYGGSFNPPHYSHFLATTWALCTGEVEQVWMVPCFHHAFGKELAPYTDRLTMCRLGSHHLTDSVFVSDCESQIKSPYTIDTIEFLIKKFPNHQFRLMIGSDIAHETPYWKSFSVLAKMAPPLWVPRGGYLPEVTHCFSLPAISSSLIRSRLATGQSVDDCLPPPVLRYIQERGLYTNRIHPLS